MLALQSTPLHLPDQDKQETSFDQQLLFPGYPTAHHNRNRQSTSPASVASHHHPRHHTYHHPPLPTVSSVSAALMPHFQSQSARLHLYQTLFHREFDLKQDLAITLFKGMYHSHHHYNINSHNNGNHHNHNISHNHRHGAEPRSHLPRVPISRPDNGLDQTPIHKIETRISQMTVEDYAKEKIVLLLTGSFCPIHLHHTEMLEAAKARMEQELGSESAMILGGFLSPSHDLYVGEKLKGEDLVLNSKERLELCRLQTSDSDWIDVDPWESMQDQFYDYHKVTSRLQQYLQEKCQTTLKSKMKSLVQQQQQQHNHNPNYQQMQHMSCAHPMVPQRSGSLAESSRNPFNIRVVYICGADFVLRTGARKLVGGIVVVDRPLGPPSSNRRSILLTNTGGSISVPVSNQMEKDELSDGSASDDSSTSTSSSLSVSSTLTAKQRVFRRLEQSYGFEWCEASRNNIWWLPARSRTESEDISSTRIRSLLSDRKSCKGLLHPLVAQRLLEKRAHQDGI